MAEKRCREKKTSKDQYEIYCTFMEQHKEVATKKFSDQTVQQLWEELAVLLNCVKSGPSKDRRSWQKTFENWRNSVRHKKRQEEAFRNGGAAPEKPCELKDTEIRALALWENKVLVGESKSNAEVDFDPNLPCKMEETFFSSVLGSVVDDEDDCSIGEDSNIAESIINCVTQPSESIASAKTTSELIIPKVDPISSVGQATRKRKRKDELWDMLINTEIENSAAVREIGNQLRRYVDVKAAEVAESRRRTDALNNIAEAIKMLVSTKKETN